jgi:ribonuclease P protein component
LSKADTDSESFDRCYRLLERHQFDRVFEKPVRLIIPPFTLLFRENQLGHPRLGFVISKKNVRLSVGRNRIRRQARESFRRNRLKLPGVDLVLLVRRDIKSFQSDQVKDALDKLWQRLGDG